MRIRLPCLLSGLAKLLACLGLARRQRKTRVFAQHCTWICSGRVSSLSSAMQGNAKGMLCVDFLKALGHAFPRPAWSDSVRIEEHPMIQAHPAKTYDVPEPANDQLEGYSKDPKMQKLYFGSLESLLGRFWHPCRRNRLAVYTARWSLASDPDTKRTKQAWNWLHLETDLKSSCFCSLALPCTGISLQALDLKIVQSNSGKEQSHRTSFMTGHLLWQAWWLHCLVMIVQKLSLYVQSLAEDWRYIIKDRLHENLRWQSSRCIAFFGNHYSWWLIEWSDFCLKDRLRIEQGQRDKHLKRWYKQPESEKIWCISEWYDFVPMNDVAVSSLSRETE